MRKKVTFPKLDEKEKTSHIQLMSDEKEKEEDTLEHWSHEHLLTLVETRIRDYCYGCEHEFSEGEEAYGCSIKIKGEGCEYKMLLHEECAEMARKIRYPLIAHDPQHILVLRYHSDLMSCNICGRYIWSIGYKCTSRGCWFEMHMRCAQASGGVIDATTDDACGILHPSHPEHELKLFKRRCSFFCDACGTSGGRGTSYACTTHACEYWIHERCASLPQTIQREDHHHSLSIAFHVPLEYIKYDYKCDVCSKDLRTKYWIYHCQLCSFAIHLKCALNKSSRDLTFINVAKDIIHLPTNDVAQELIAPFVMRQGGTIAHDDVMINVKYDFPHHQHLLTLISSSHHHHNNNNDDDDDGKRSEVLICDGCITPIFPSSSSSYMSCSSEDCKYNLHMACFRLPHQLPSHPFHHEDDHHLILQSSDKLQPWEFKECSVCRYPTNGLYYACTKCDFIADIKCASLGDTIYHAAHRQHLLKYVTAEDMRQSRDIYSLFGLSCAARCGNYIFSYDCYECDTCSSDFIVHVRCALLPASVTSRTWDKKHPLPLTYDATLNRPGDFYCNQCEEEMNPKSWMYHCRHCDISFHPKCFPVTSGDYRNVKLGQQYVIGVAHSHTLTFQLLTTKRSCDLCQKDRYGYLGFHCASCNFFICLISCGYHVIGNVTQAAVG